MFISDASGTLMGVGSLEIDSFVNAFCFGTEYQQLLTQAIIPGSATDSGNTPTWILRQGLVMGQQTGTSQWVPYASGNTDGSQVAAGILFGSLRMQDVNGNTRQCMSPILVSGGVVAKNLLGFDNQARQQMRRFVFDDIFPGSWSYPWLATVAKTANYAATANDNNTLFTNAGAGGAVTITLPPITNGLVIGIYGVANQNIAVTSNEGTNIVTTNNAAASTITFSTGSQIIGSYAMLFTNPAGTLWYSALLTPNTATIS
jgi:hypothetical protein